MRHASLAAMFGVAVFATAAEPTVFVKPAESASLSAPKTTRRVSSETTARLAANSPKYDPPPALATKPAELVDLREVDRPRNEIIRLAPVLVLAPKPPVFKDREILTPKAKLDRMFKKRPGLLVGNFFGLNLGVAAGMIAEEERLERMEEFSELVGILELSGDPKMPEMHRMFETTFMRAPELRPVARSRD